MLMEDVLLLSLMDLFSRSSLAADWGDPGHRCLQVSHTHNKDLRCIRVDNGKGHEFLRERVRNRPFHRKDHWNKDSRYIERTDHLESKFNLS